MRNVNILYVSLVFCMCGVLDLTELWISCVQAGLARSAGVGVSGVCVCVCMCVHACACVYVSVCDNTSRVCVGTQCSLLLIHCSRAPTNR